MAKVTTPHPIHGKIGPYIFSVRNGKQYIRQAPTEYKFRQGTPAHGLNRQEFAGAAKLAADIYRQIRGSKASKKLGAIFCAYPQNRITARLKQGAERDRKLLGERFHYAQEFRFHDTARAIVGLDLSPDDAPSDQVRMTPIGPLHNPTHVQVTGLDRAAEAIVGFGNARLELRFHLRQARIQELQFNSETESWKTTAEAANDHNIAVHTRPLTAPSDWIPAEIIPAEGFKIPIPQWHPDAKYATSILIEWRQVHAVGRKVRHLPQKTVVKIASLHAPAAAWQSPKRHQHPTEIHHLHIPQKPQPKIDWRTDPATFIQKALQKIQV